MKKNIFKIAATIIFISLISCNASKNKKSENKKMLATNYIVEKINTNIELKVKPSLIFNLDENKVSGFAGCNRFNGNFIKEGNTIKFNQIISTKMYCTNMKIEKSFFNLLSNTVKYKILDGKLLLLDKKDSTLAILIENVK